jgi:hypothetical protein
MRNLQGRPYHKPGRKRRFGNGWIVQKGETISVGIGNQKVCSATLDDLASRMIDEGKFARSLSKLPPLDGRKEVSCSITTTETKAQ